MTDWSFADVFDAIARAIPDRPCQIQGERVVTWGDFDRRADALAAAFLGAGLGHQSKVACYLYNCPEYLETVVAAFKVAMAPVNTNYRYGPEEIRYLFDNADVEAVVFHAGFAPLLDAIRTELPRVRAWFVVDDGSPRPDWATPYETTVVSGAHPAPAWGRSGDDLLLLYTGGTTGMPKGVMWRQDDLFNVVGAGGSPITGVPPATSVDEIVERLPADPAASVVMVVACPLMHGTGQFSSLIAMIGGGAVVSLDDPRHFDVAALFQTIERRRATNVVIVGQAFAGPMLEHLDANPGRYDLSSVNLISSSGVMWSQENKQGLLRHLPQAMLFDSFGSSEAVGLGASVSVAGAPEQTARFAIGPNNAVFTEDGRRVEPGSDEIGQIAVGGFLPIGYYKDEAKSAATFRTIEGRRWSIPGDFATVNADGTIKLLGRGSVCINTGGEKVFPEEVEEVLKTHPAVRDAVVVGLPDERFGERICAVVETAPDAEVTLDDVKAHVTEHLAAYKAPRELVVVPTIGRAANGKVDYRGLRAHAIERTGA
ncbi:MAG: acyl-CoA synthetase [Ilumatobacteraceae bacterium]|nr:acyl-CoA synthetase [Ilumatobacteraceae bacterium]